jgi:hypothetical protein
MHALHARTGTEMIFIAVRSDVTDYLGPLVSTTSERGVDFIRLATKSDLTTLALRYEAYCLSGIEGRFLVYPHQCIVSHEGSLLRFRG